MWHLFFNQQLKPLSETDIDIFRSSWDMSATALIIPYFMSSTEAGRGKEKTKQCHKGFPVTTKFQMCNIRRSRMSVKQAVISFTYTAYPKIQRPSRRSLRRALVKLSYYDDTIIKR